MANLIYFFKMFRNKKAGSDPEEVVGIMMIFVVFIVLIIIVASCDSFYEKKKLKEVDFTLENINSEYNLVSFLNLQLEDGITVSDKIDEAVLSNNYDEIKALSKSFFDDLYRDRHLSYVLTINNNRMHFVDFTETVSESNIILPSSDTGTIRVRLIIGNLGVAII